MPEEIAMGKPITEDEVRGLFQLWNGALATLDPKKVAARYAKAGVLLPTVSDQLRTDFASLKDYFDAFLLKKPQGTILESNVMIGTNWYVRFLSLFRVVLRRRKCILTIDVLF